MIRQLQSFWRYARGHGRGICCALLLLAADVAVTTALPWMMSEIVDRGVLAGRLDVIRQVGLRMTLLSIGGSAVALLFSLVTSVMAQRISNEMRRDLIAHTLSLSYGQTDDFSSGTLLTRILSDTQIVTQFGAAVLQMLLKPAALFVLGFVMTLRISGQFALIFALAIPLQALLLILFMKKLQPLFVRIQLTLEKINTRVQETLGSLRLIRVSLQQEQEARAFQGDNGELLGLNLRIQYLLAVMNPLIMLVINAVLIALIALGGSLARGGLAEAGQIIAAIMYVQQIMMSLMMIGQIYQIAGRAAVSCGRLDEILALSPTLPEGTEPLREPVRSLEGRGVTYRYAPGAEDRPPAVDRVDFSVPAGSFIALIGPTGSGKSTLAALMARLRAPTEGEILLNGRPLTDWEAGSVRARIVPVLQENTMISGSLADNIRFGLNADEEAVRAAARIAQADGFISRLPAGYETPVAQQGTSLSGGQKQCVAIARALLRRPEVLILDDSASALDTQTEARLRAAIREVFPKMTLIVATQRIPTVTDADQIWLMEDGRISARGTHAELLAASPLYREMAEALQSGEVAP